MLCENLKRQRETLGLSQEELAERIHVVRQTVSKWEKGRSVPDAEMLVRLAEELHVPVRVLLGESSETDEGERPEMAEIAERLEELNARFAAQQERRGKTLRRVCFAVLILSAIVLTRETAAFLYGRMAAAELRENAAVIGGGDTTTNIFVSALSINTWLTGIALLALATALFGLWRMRRK